MGEQTCQVQVSYCHHLETIKTSNRDGKSRHLICWDEYLSRFKYEIMHVPGVTNKVADCLSRYYENDRYDEIHESHHYVSADVRLDPNYEDLTDLHLQEILELQPSALLLARRLWCRTLKHHHFCTTKIAHAILVQFLIPLTERLLLMQGLSLSEQLLFESKLRE